MCSIINKPVLIISQNSRESTCAGESFSLVKSKGAGLRETLAQIFSCEIYKFSEYNFYGTSSGHCFCQKLTNCLTK